jgi:hypothetical protein
MIRRIFSVRVWAVLSTVGLGLLAANVIFSPFQGQSPSTILQPDTPPGEYLYLDRSRVRSYLGQLVDGLLASEKRTLADSEELAADVKAGGAGFSGGRKRSASTEAQVAPTAADRFYLLLRLLRAGKSRDESGHSRHWLVDLGAQTERPQNVYEAACHVQERDFVRIRNAHLYLSPYAAVLPKATYAHIYLTGHVTRPTPRILSPRTRAERRRVDRYLRLLGKDPRLPFIVRTISGDPGHGRPAGVTFFLPARYQSLRDEPSLISGTVTIVGKVVYRNLGRVDRKHGGRFSCGRRLPTSVSSKYIDHMTVATFVPALRAAPKFVFNNLWFDVRTIAKQVTANMTVAAPVVVVIPIAMYQ